MKLSIRMYLDKSKLNKLSKSVIKCRLTYLRKRKEFSTGQFINPKNWDSKQQLVKPPEHNNKEINAQLSLIKTKLNKAFLLLQVKEEDFTVDDVYNLYLGKKTQNEYNVVEYYEIYLNKLKTLIGIDIKQKTWDKFEYVKIDIKSFIKWKFKVSDIALKKLRSNFLDDFEYYLKVIKKLKQVTINKKIQRFRRIVKVAVAENYLDKDPFLLYKSKTVKTQVVFLSTEELNTLEEYEFVQPRLQYVKDLFVFCCYTGLPYRELMDLKPSNIVIGFDGNKWIKMNREKTSKPLSIPLLPKALQILERYISDATYVFARISNQRYNSYLKEIAAIIGIDKNLTTHMARRTFASTVLLYNDVPMEVVSELLGHGSIQTTEDSYAKVVQKKVSMEIERLRQSD